MKWAITGGAGFIGYRLTSLLLHTGHQVTVFDNFSEDLYSAARRRQRMESLARDNPLLSLHDIDVCVSLTSEPLADVDVIVHCAGLPGTDVSWHKIDRYVQANEVSTWRVVEALRDSREHMQAHLIHISTSSVYGDYSGGGEAAPFAPISPYGVSKVAAELVVQLAKPWLHKTSILRLFSAYGPEQRPDMAYAKFIDAIANFKPVTITGSGMQRRTNTFVDDIARAIIAVGEGGLEGIYNVSGVETYSILEVVQKIEALMGEAATLEFVEGRRGDQQTVHARPTRLMQETEWRPCVSLDEGLEAQIAAYRRRNSRT